MISTFSLDGAWCFLAFGLGGEYHDLLVMLLLAEIIVRFNQEVFSGDFFFFFRHDHWDFHNHWIMSVCYL